MKYVSLLVFLLFLVGCTPQNKTEEQKKEEPLEERKVDLKSEVMDIHDEVMPKMGELRKTQKELLALANSSSSDSSVVAKYHELAHNIELANEAMMDWMRSFNPNFEGSEAEVKEYLELKLEGIKSVKKHMLNSLEAGKEAL